MDKITPFHVAVPVYDLDEARKFYREVLGCGEGRSDTNWTDFNLYGHQFVIHLKPKPVDDAKHHFNPVDGHDVPVPHFGVVLEWDDWVALEAKLKSLNVKFVIEPYIRFKGLPGEQATMFFLDPSGNALEFKAFKDIGQLFAV
ncbi:VOC family protein [Mucilaginibacter ginsenosidivorax]|uniref:Glyoxalase n=1 Tax=Mucilaginibacter ginsenosidivorax TaxID=862126 RepID=A0A5B8VU70_9SPHI|nr:VOC family protein [Mucilaginibacter ginsenosidivorax]QEC75157.1 glyoxalase [Mucilaginibacter ginsenosidivorax]